MSGGDQEEPMEVRVQVQTLNTGTVWETSVNGAVLLISICDYWQWLSSGETMLFKMVCVLKYESPRLSFFCCWTIEMLCLPLLVGAGQWGCPAASSTSSRLSRRRSLCERVCLILKICSVSVKAVAEFLETKNRCVQNPGFCFSRPFCFSVCESESMKMKAQVQIW